MRTLVRESGRVPLSPSAVGGASVALQLLTGPASRSTAAAASVVPTDTRPAGVTAAPDATRIVLSLAAVEAAFGAESFLMQTARGRADTVEVSTSVIPEDKDAFRARVLAYLGENMASDSGFMAALAAGKVTVNTVDDVPKLNIQPMVSFTLFQNGHSTGGGTFSPDGTNHALYQALSATRGQSIGSLGNSQLHAWWPKAA
ncbi:MAG: hypothetical protein MUF73_11355 [Rhodobacteraceae bacterium]|jgi:hypothetical protein|nr:hypothetical protein [Paracoccaceae bacterium]